MRSSSIFDEIQARRKKNIETEIMSCRVKNSENPTRKMFNLKIKNVLPQQCQHSPFPSVLKYS